MPLCTRCDPLCDPIEIFRETDDGVLLYHGRSRKYIFVEDCDCSQFARQGVYTFKTVKLAIEYWLREIADGALYFSIHVEGKGHLLLNYVID